MCMRIVCDTHTAPASFFLYIDYYLFSLLLNIQLPEL